MGGFEEQWERDGRGYEITEAFWRLKVDSGTLILMFVLSKSAILHCKTKEMAYFEVLIPLPVVDRWCIAVSLQNSQEIFTVSQMKPSLSSF